MTGVCEHAWLILSQMTTFLACVIERSDPFFGNFLTWLFHRVSFRHYFGFKAELHGDVQGDHSHPGHLISRNQTFSHLHIQLFGCCCVCLKSLSSSSLKVSQFGFLNVLEHSFQVIYQVLSVGAHTSNIDSQKTFSLVLCSCLLETKPD